MTKKYSPEQIESALRHESEVTEILARVSRAEDYIKDTQDEIRRLERKLEGQLEARDLLIKDLDRLDRMKADNKELFDLFKSVTIPVEKNRVPKKTSGGRMPKISTKEKILLIQRALKEFDENREDHIWDDPKTVPLYFIKDFIEKVKDTEIGNITIWMRKAIEQGNFKLVGRTRTRAIRVS